MMRNNVQPVKWYNRYSVYPLYIHPSKFYFSSVCPFKWQIVTYLQDVHSHKTEFFPYHPVCAAVEFNHAGFLEIMRYPETIMYSINKAVFWIHAGFQEFIFYKLCGFSINHTGLPEIVMFSIYQTSFL